MFLRVKREKGKKTLGIQMERREGGREGGGRLLHKHTHTHSSDPTRIWFFLKRTNKKKTECGNK